MDEQEYIELHHFARNAYLSYGMATLLDRALPDVRDGLKPVQRRILYAMMRNRLTADAKPSKSARVVGEVLGKFHPHGDQSVYDAMVRMAQDFTLRYPLISGQGNWGRRDGDGAAAMRYTECRLSPHAAILLDEIDAGTVDFRDNYDSTLKEPVCLPAQLPHVLLNPVSGIAVGMATEIPPHNLREVAEAACAVIQNPDVSLDEILKRMPGPDFPGGGEIVSTPEEIEEIYRTGRGRLRVRARWRVERLPKGQWRIVVYELPHRTSASAILEKIESLVNPAPAPGNGKKRELSQKQKQTRQYILSLLSEMRDESSGKDGLRLVFEPRSSRQDPEEMMRALMSLTDLACNHPVNLVTLGLDGRPKRKGLLEILSEWARFRIETVTRRSRTRLAQIRDRVHLLEGRLLAFANLDEVIAIIREADDPKSSLMERFGISEAQADDILGIRLRQLARLERLALETERGKLLDEAETLERLLSDDKALRRQIVREIRSLAKRFGDDRRTVLNPVARESEQREYAPAAPSEPVTVILSQKGFIRSRNGHNIDPAGLSWKPGDGLLAAAWTTSDSELVLLDSRGRSYCVQVAAVPGGRGDGVPISALIDLQPNARVIAMLSDAPDAAFLIASTAGYGFIADLAAMVTKRRAGKDFLTVPEGHQALAPVKVPGDGDDLLAVIKTKKRRALAFPLAEIKKLPKGKGVKLIALDDDDAVESIGIFSADEAASEDLGDMKRLVGKRAGRGKAL